VIDDEWSETQDRDGMLARRFPLWRIGSAASRSAIVAAAFTRELKSSILRANIHRTRSSRLQSHAELRNASVRVDRVARGSDLT